MWPTTDLAAGRAGETSPAAKNSPAGWALPEPLRRLGRTATGGRGTPRPAAGACTGALARPPGREMARLAPLPPLMPRLAQRRPPIPHVRVSATRASGEIVAIGGSGRGWRDWVAGREWPVHKTSVGGWSQDRYQRSVEEAWDENAKALAAEVVAAADRIGAQHVVVAGDVRARALLLGHLSTPLQIGRAS